MSKAFDKLLDHDYDGIKEYDNPLPGWWKWLWILTILFSFVYFPFYHIYGAPGVLAALALKSRRPVPTKAPSRYRPTAPGGQTPGGHGCE